VESGAQMIAALEHGASGYLSADLPADDLAKTLRAAHAGEPALSRSLVPHLIDRLRRAPSSRLELGDLTVTLTPRERDVVELVGNGWPTDEIAVRLGVSAVTVRRHISSVAKKVGVPGRAALAETLRRSTR
jgi:DNA-binding NarL/FixJ family response regulator